MNKTLYIKKEHAGIWKEAKKLIDFKTESTLSEVLTHYLRDTVIPDLKTRQSEIE